MPHATCSTTHHYGHRQPQLHHHTQARTHPLEHRHTTDQETLQTTYELEWQPSTHMAPVRHHKKPSLTHTLTNATRTSTEMMICASTTAITITTQSYHNKCNHTSPATSQTPHTAVQAHRRAMVTCLGDMLHARHAIYHTQQQSCL